MAKSCERKQYWHSIDWKECVQKVKYIQGLIAVAYQSNNIGEVHRIQHNLVKSFAGRAIAVRQVITNPGKKTPGVDGVVWDSSEKRHQAILDLYNLENYKCKRVKRIYIPKTNGGLRPLGIPTIHDRGVQTLWKLALEPIAECKADTHSYGFRKYRSTQDVQTFIHLLLCQRSRPDWVMDANIKGFFDNISHQWMLDNIPMEKRILNEWLKAEALDRVKREEIDTSAGVPQGGPISPVLANMVLDGLENHILTVVKHLRRKSKKTGQWSPKVNVIRYADDFVITAATKRLLENLIRPKVTEFLAIRGLELNLSKTHIISPKNGFDFLGFHFRIYPFAKGPNGFISLTKPSKKGIKRVCDKIRLSIDPSKDVSSIILKLNPILRGWSNYYSTVVSKRIFTQIGRYLWIRFWIWAKKKNPTLARREVAKKYFTKVGNRNWVFTGKYEDKTIYLFDIANVPIRRHVIITKDKNPFLPIDNDYFERRILKGTTQSILWDQRKRIILSRTKFICLVCGEPILPNEEIDIHHILPRKDGGSNDVKNLVGLHRICHKQMTYTKDKKLLARFKESKLLREEDQS